ncbi:DNA-binding protein [Pseudomonas sp. BGr12]|uniref:DNA-binding protein n=1 Tax=unclassified Pseudomonas TaxID=196821 RepID=UPI0017827370|nr:MULTISPECIES: DNA-binding protein [unclassified Pseudomonas]MBD9575113.1 DNA-binding protein [Pseudomonas sp. PDM23]MBD9669945.1 DNA-binding protein [Pseudomonas sp. PDM21]MDL2427756.1 DNA-binding protein [Pseudomonas sp. BJa5]
MNDESGFSPDLLAGGYYVTPQRFAQLVGLKDRPAIVQGWIDEGAIPTRRLGGQVLVDLGALLLMTQPDQA